MLKKHCFLDFLLKHCFTLYVVWILSLFVFKLSVMAGLIILLLLIFLPLFAFSFTFLELCYYFKPVIRLHVVVKWFYYVAFGLSLLVSVYYAQHSLGYLFTILFFSVFILFLLFMPFLTFKISFAILSITILAYLCQSIILGFQNIQLLLFSLLLMIAVYSFLHYAILDVDTVILELRDLFRKMGRDVGNLDLLFGFRSFSSKFLLLHGYLKDVCKLDKVLKSYVDVGSLANILDFVSKFPRMSKAKDVKEFLLSLPPQIKDVRNIMAHGAKINLYRGVRCENWGKHRQVALKETARFLYRVYLAEIYPLYLQLFYGIRDKVVGSLPMRS